MRVLVVNAGSSSLKLRVVDDEDTVVARADLGADGDVAGALGELGTFDAAGHRIVHGGAHVRAPARIDDAVRRALGAAADLAPLHAPPALRALDAVAAARPDVPAVACPDTAFHAGLPAAAATYPLPREWRDRLGVRRFGFHGLSHAWVARQAGPGRVVSCHLGAGASLCAIADGASVDTTMGFTPLEGVVMATRSGTVDPGLVLWLLGEGGLSRAEVEEGLERRSGLLGLAGTKDMREVLGRDDDDARLALDVYVHRLRAGIAAMAAALGGLDTLVFTGGIGERAAPLRERAAAGLGFLGVAVDPDRNAAAEPDADVTAAGAAVRTLVVAAREDLEIAREVRAVLGA